MSLLRFIVLLILAAPATADNVLTVGRDPARCDHTSLEAALAAAAPTRLTTIRLANDQRYSAVRLSNGGKSIALQGGFKDCDQARLPSGTIGDTRTVISGSAEFHPADVLDLAAIDLRLSAPLILDGPLTITLEHVDVQSAQGAAVEVLCRDAIVVLRESTLRVRSLSTDSDCALIGWGVR